MSWVAVGLLCAVYGFLLLIFPPFGSRGSIGQNLSRRGKSSLKVGELPPPPRIIPLKKEGGRHEWTGSQ